MKKHFIRAFYQGDKIYIVAALLFLLTFFISSCQDDYIYDDEEPEWLGDNIYSLLKERGNFTVTVRLIEDLDYDEVLSRTGSKTLFVATDSAYIKFFTNNSWGVKKYEDLSEGQKKLLLNFSMINNAYTLQKFANYYYGGNLIEGTAMRQETNLSPIDSIPFENGDKLPTSPVWNYYRSKGIHLLKDNTQKPIVYFTNDFITKYGITGGDFSMLTNGKTRVTTDVYLFDNKVIERDIRCKNGYVHVLDGVMVPPTNMAQYIHDNYSTNIFSKLLDRFCVPLYDKTNTELYKTLHPGFSDSIFVKRYYASLGGITRLIDSKHEESGVIAKNLLGYDPGWNSFRTGALEADMAAMFVPNDEAMNSYFNGGVGAILKERFHEWDSVPDAIILPFIKRHMRSSMVESVPSKFSKMVDTENYRLPVEGGHIDKSYTAVNGEVYVTNQVYPPVDYISVYSPVLLSSNSKIMNWAINISQTSVDGTLFAFYKLYLNSLVSKYALFIPTDEYMAKYIDPISYAQSSSGVLKYWYNNTSNAVNATIYAYDKTNDIVGDSIGVITTSTFLQNRLWELLDSHIVIGDIETGADYFITKGNDIIKISGSGASLSVQGGGDIQRNTQCNVTKVFTQYNGKTYFIDKPIQSSLRSVYENLYSRAEFSEFFNLLIGVPESYLSQIFAQQGIDYRIKFFNAYRYTVYVPTNEALQKAVSDGVIKTWTQIDAITDDTERALQTDKTVRFLKYHFQDNSVFIGQAVDGQFQSATIKTDNTDTHFGTAKNKYFKLGVKTDGATIKITMDSKTGSPLRTAKVILGSGLYNIIAKDYIFARKPSEYKNIDGTGAVSGIAFGSSSISTSASAVIHQIDNVLTFE